MRPSIVALAATAVWTLASVAQAQTPAALAQQRLLRGLSLYDARRFAEALEEFRGSYALRASPNSRLYSARALRELQRLPEAVTEFETCVQEARENALTDARYRDTQNAAQQELAELEGRVGRVRLTLANAPRQVTVRLGPQELPAAGLSTPLPVAPGALSVSAEAPGNVTLTQTVAITAGSTAQVTLTFPTHAQQLQDEALARRDGVSSGTSLGAWLARGRSPLRPLLFASLGLGVAGMLTFAVAGGVTASSFAGVQARCGAAPCPASEQGVVDAGRATQVAANVSLGVGLAGLAAGVVLLFVGPRVERSAQGPALSFGLEGATVRGAF